MDDDGGEFNSTETFTDWNSTDWNTGEGMHVKLQAHQILNVLLYCLIVVLGVPGNAVVIWITGFKMKRTVNSIWFLNLACADLLCCLSLPFMMYKIIHDHHWPFGLYMCRVIHGFILLNMFCSIFLLVVISLDRFILVAKPVWCQNNRNTRCASIVVCFLVWMLSMLLALPIFIYRREFKGLFGNKIFCLLDLSRFAQNTQLVKLGIIIHQFLLGFLLPFGFITVCHFLILQRVSQNGRGFGNRSKKMVRLICVVIVTFFLCWLPYHIKNFLLVLTPFSIWNFNLLTIHIYALALAYFSSCLNPLLYMCMGQGFKEHMQKSLRSVMENFMPDDGTSHSSKCVLINMIVCTER
uniref:Complement C5a receptor 1 n=1 Tax=Erpetoichthys calabaricus TaxID=27687 RepID=A0A8C4X288_ERPCA